MDPVSRVFGIGILPSMCLIMTIFSWFLYRVTVMSYAITARCVPMHEFWFPFRQGTWPLSGLFFFIFFLLIALHVVVLCSPGSRRKAGRATGHAFQQRQAESLVEGKIHESLSGAI